MEPAIDAYLAARPGLVELSEEEMRGLLDQIGYPRQREAARLKLSEALSRV